MSRFGLPIRTCYVRACSSEVEGRKLFCYAHWRQLTPELQERVHSSWKSNHLSREHFRAYLEAAREALAFINDSEVQIEAMVGPQP